MRRDYVLIIKNSLTGEQIRVPDAQLLTTDDKSVIINAYTREWTSNQIGYYVTYLYEQ